MKATTAGMTASKPALALQLEPDPCVWSRPTIRGKFLWVDDEKFFVRAVTYGPFRPDRFGTTYPALEIVEQDFALMAAQGINAIRTYNAPPRPLLDVAQKHRLRVMVGLQAERHFAFLEDSKSHPGY